MICLVLNLALGYLECDPFSVGAEGPVEKGPDSPHKLKPCVVPAELRSTKFYTPSASPVPTRFSPLTCHTLLGSLRADY